MKYFFALNLLVFVLSSSLNAQDPTSLSQSMIDAAVDKVKPALVRIHVVEAGYYGGRSVKTEASGSGVVISPEGLIVTNHHVAGDAVWLMVTMHTREEIPARLIGSDPMADIAVIKLEPKVPQTFAYAAWGDSDVLRVGDVVLAMGSPMALSQSVTQGIVSNTQMIMPWMENLSMAGEDVGSIVRWIGHDAAIFPGNSGGPLVNMQGEIIGINELGIGLGGAIPGNLAHSIADQLIAKGEIERAFVGMVLRPRFKENANTQGVIINDVIADSPAAKAGVLSGDLLVQIEDEKVNARFAEEIPPLNLLIASLPIQQPVKVTVARNGTEIPITMTPEKREKAQPRQREFLNWGMTASDLSFWLAFSLKRPNKNGVFVTSVSPGGACGLAKPEINTGDVILSINGAPVNSMAELLEITAQLIQGKTDRIPALVSFARKGEEMLTVVEIGIQPLPPPERNVRTAWLPISTQVLTRELAKQLGIEGKTGVRVTQVYATTSADDAASSATQPLQTVPPTAGDLKVGDLIVALEGEPIPASEPHETEVFPQLIRQYKIGSEATMTVIRDSQPMEMTIKLGARPPQSRELDRFRDYDFGLTVRNSSYFDRVDRRWEDTPQGVIIDAIDEGGWVSLARLNTGDFLMSIQGEPIRNVKDVTALLEKLKQSKPVSVIFKVRRDSIHQYFEVEPLWHELDEAMKP